MLEMGLLFGVVARADISVIRTLALRQGASRKMRHIDARHFFVQDLVDKKIVVAQAVNGTENVADIGTKHLPSDKMQQMRARLHWQAD